VESHLDNLIPMQASIIDFTPGTLPFTEGGIPSLKPDAQLKKKDFAVNYSESSKGSTWQNDILVDKGTLGSAPGSSMFETGVNFGDQYGLPLELDNMSVGSSNSAAVMPSAEELSFLLDFDDRQMSKSGRYDGQARNKGEACNSRRQPQANFFGGDYEVSPTSLQVIANTLPVACDLMDDLATDPQGPRQPTSVAFPQTSAAPPAADAAATTSEPRSFPWKLHEMLGEVQTTGFQDIISWEPDGMAFKVHDCQLFVEKVMPLYFDQSRYESFRRQLRKYGFSRLNKDRYRGAYHHKHFQKVNKQLCKYIKRGTKSKSKAKETKQTDTANSSGSQKVASVY
jgi:hypothetical protein